MTLALLRVDSEFTVYENAAKSANLVIQIVAPPAPKERLPANLVIALDVSGSMGDGKLSRAEACIRALANSLEPKDRLAILTFNRNVSVLLEASFVNESVLEWINGEAFPSTADGHTDIHRAVISALRIADSMGSNVRVIFLTDGCPTCGVTDGAAIVSAVGGRSNHVVVSTFGYGDDVDPILLSQMAASGGGDYSYIDGNEVPLAAMGSELGALISAVGTEVELRVALSSDKVSTGPLGARFSYARDFGHKKLTAQLPPLLNKETVYIPFELAWSEPLKEDSVALVTLRYRDACSGEIEVREAHARLVFGEGRGGARPELVKELLLRETSRHLMSMSENGVTAADIEASAILEGEILARANAAGIGNDEQLQTALEMLRKARKFLLSGAFASHRHDAVAHANALEKRKSAKMGYNFSQDEHTMITTTQAAGYAEIQKKYR